MPCQEENKQSDQLAEYRKWLVASEQKSQKDFDKTVLSLSGGALGISFVFLKDVIGPKEIVLSGFLLAAWLGWAFSTFSVLTSYYLSHLALRRAISQVDYGTIYKQTPGGAFNRVTAILNATGAVLFLVGVCCITVFAGANLSTKGGTNDRTKTTISSAATNNTTAASNNTTANPNEGQARGGRLLIPICIQVDTVIYTRHGGEPWRDRFKSVLKRYKEPGSCVIRRRRSQSIARRFL